MYISMESYRDLGIQEMLFSEVESEVAVEEDEEEEDEEEEDEEELEEANEVEEVDDAIEASSRA
jgi:hypothetical protein